MKSCSSFLLLLSTRIIVSSLVPMTNESNREVLIAVDTVFLRDRTKHVELLARVHDHNIGRYHKGFRMLTMGWPDGSTSRYCCPFSVLLQRRIARFPCVTISISELNCHQCILLAKSKILINKIHVIQKRQNREEMIVIIERIPV